MTVAVVQTKQSSSGYTATFDGTPTPGNVILAIATRNDNPGGSITFSGIPCTFSNLLQAHSSFGGIGYFGYRVYQAGDGSSLSTNASGNIAILIAELAGLSPLGPTGGFSYNNQQNSANITISAAGLVALAGFVTRLKNGGTFTPGANTTQINGLSIPGSTFNGAGILAYNPTGGTVAGTQGGTTQDGYWFGGAVLQWAEASKARSQAIVIA